MSEVKKWDINQYEGEWATMGEDTRGDYVLASDYAALEAECKRLLDLLADWSSHFTGPKVIGGPLSSLRERTDAAMLGGAA